MNTEVLINFAAVPAVEITQDLPDGTPTVRGDLAAIG